MKRITLKSLSASLLLAISICAGCGGGGGGGGGGGAATPGEKLGGIWFGTVTNDLEPGVVKSMIGFTTDAGELRLVVDTGTQSVGAVSSNGNSLSGSVVSYAPLGYVFNNGESTTTDTIAGAIVERQSLEGSWVDNIGETGDFVLMYDDRHQLPSSFATVSGIYTGYEDSVPVSTLVIEDTGNLYAEDTWGCIYTGHIQIIDANFNMYRVYVDVANCESANGSYTGLAAYDPSDDSLAYQIDNSLYVVSNEVYKN